MLPVWNSLPNVNPDEVLAALDADTRRYLMIVANAGVLRLARRWALTGQELVILYSMLIVATGVGGMVGGSTGASREPQDWARRPLSAR